MLLIIKQIKLQQIFLSNSTSIINTFILIVIIKKKKKNISKDKTKIKDFIKDLNVDNNSCVIKTKEKLLIIVKVNLKEITENLV